MFSVRRLAAQFFSVTGQAKIYSAGTMSAGNISCEELKKLQECGTAQVFDVRNPEEVERGKIPGAVNIPVAEFEKAFQLDPEIFEKTYKVQKPREEAENFVVHCQMGRRGAQAAQIAASLGYKRVRNLTGGYKEWAEMEGAH
ncbi:thiosulfate:glutathione sulfurtransferase [Spea bombifrons]|uniref:thiosulfate:glutathione sulfurtransferase n=1 Tax=Spea bombifrons TaxID=233779 RepID=UPI00234BBBB1|nr:thiosulfate:glutathione sulfurtransferase [Spea bombifrons]